MSDHLTEKFGRGFSKANLEFFRRFYLNYEDRIAETVYRRFAIEKTETVFRQLEENPPFVPAPDGGYGAAKKAYLSGGAGSL